MLYHYYWLFSLSLYFCLSRGKESSTLDPNSQSCQFVRELLKEQAVFPTRANKWVSLANKPILCDDDSAEIEKLFMHNPLVHLLNMADKDKLGRTIREPKGRRGRDGSNKENVKQFLEACQIQSLSECVEREFVPTLLQASPNVQLFLHTICPYIQLYISTQSQVCENGLCVRACWFDLIFTLSMNIHPYINMVKKVSPHLGKRALTKHTMTQT